MASTRDFEQLFEASPDALIAIDSKGLIVLANFKAEQLFGYRRDQLIGQAVEMLVPEAVRERHVGHRTGYMKNPVTRPMGAEVADLRGRHANGEEFPVLISLSTADTSAGMLVVAAIRLADSITPGTRSEVRAIVMASTKDYAEHISRRHAIWTYLAALGSAIAIALPTIFVVKHTVEQRARRICGQVTQLAAIQESTQREQNVQSAVLVKTHPRLLGLRPTELKRLTAQSQAIQARQLAALQSLASRDCRS